jgi:hypothetical protein
MQAPEPLPADLCASDALVDAADARSRAMLERQLEVLGRLAEVGLQVALAAERQAQADPDAAALQSIALAYSRVSRAVRLTLTLQAKLAKELQDAAETEAEEAQVLEPAYRRKFRVERIVERLIKAEHDNDEDIDRLTGEAGERLDDEDLYGDILSKPLGEIVALICKDLGLNPDWAKLAEQHWARAEIESGVETSPFLPPPPKAAGGGPFADPERKPGEERMVEGAGGYSPPFYGSS